MDHIQLIKERPSFDTCKVNPNTLAKLPPKAREMAVELDRRDQEFEWLMTNFISLHNRVALQEGAAAAAKRRRNQVLFFLLNAAMTLLLSYLSHVLTK